MGPKAGGAGIRPGPECDTQATPAGVDSPRASLVKTIAMSVYAPIRPACSYALNLLGSMALLLMTLAARPASASPDRVFWNDFEPAISADAETWTWIPFDDAKCGDGSSVGLGVNLTSKSDRVLIYLEGGGACWSEFYCYFLQTATNFTGYSESDFVADTADTTSLAKPGGFFDRSAAENPFKDYSYVYVPYCTGDAHSGDNIATYGAHTAYHVGFRNMTIFLKRLADTFPQAGRIVLAGSSAGGLGATLNWWQAQQSFPGVRVDMINDAGAVMPEDVLPMPNTTEQQQRVNWNLAATLPPGCTACATSFDVIFAFYASEFPSNRGALLSYTQDNVLPFFYSISTSKFTQGLGELEAQQFAPTTTLKYFNEAGSGHELWFTPALTTNNVTVQQFVTQMVTDDLNWTSP